MPRLPEVGSRAWRGLSCSAVCWGSLTLNLGLFEHKIKKHLKLLEIFERIGKGLRPMRSS